MSKETIGFGIMSSAEYNAELRRLNEEIRRFMGVDDQETFAKLARPYLTERRLLCALRDSILNARKYTQPKGVFG